MAATLLCDRIRQEIDSGKLVGVIYLDLTKAFDTIAWLPWSLKVLECPGIFTLSWNVLEFLGLSPFVLEMSFNFALSKILILY